MLIYYNNRTNLNSLQKWMLKIQTNFNNVLGDQKNKKMHIKQCCGQNIYIKKERFEEAWENENISKNEQTSCEGSPMARSKIQVTMVDSYSWKPRKMLCPFLFYEEVQFTARKTKWIHYHQPWDISSNLRPYPWFRAYPSLLVIPIQVHSNIYITSCPQSPWQSRNLMEMNHNIRSQGQII